MILDDESLAVILGLHHEITKTRCHLFVENIYLGPFFNMSTQNFKAKFLDIFEESVVVLLVVLLVF